MFRKLIPLLVAFFAVTVVSPILAQTEDEIIAQYLKKAEKQRKHQIYFFSCSFAYGKLASQSDYNKFYNHTNLNVTPGDPLTGIWRSKQFGADFGMMVSKRASIKLGFEYWMKLGNGSTGDYNLGVSPLGLQEDFDLRSEVSVYGFSGGFDYYLKNPPDNNGLINTLSVKVGAGAGYYNAKWELWDAASSFNLSTEIPETNNEALTGSAPGISGWVGVDYPIGIFGLLASVNVNYLYLNFDNIRVYNDLNEELYVSFSDNPTDRVDLDFSGLRGKLEFKRYFRW